MTVYFYGRNSDSESFEKGSSIETQLSKCKSYANIKDLKIDVEITERVSGTTNFERREKGSELLSLLKKDGMRTMLEINSKGTHLREDTKSFPIKILL